MSEFRRNLMSLINSETSERPSNYLLYELPAPTTTKNYDTGIKLFDNPKSFTILCNATFNNYSWSSWKQGIFGIVNGTYNYMFKIGSISSGKDMSNDSVSATDNRYTAVILNPNQTDKRCVSLAARYNGNKTVKFVITYDHTTRKVYCNSSEKNTESGWYTATDTIVSNDTLKLLIGGAAGTINDFKIYMGIIPNEDINAFISSVD